MELNLILRLIVASICGGIIGNERRNKFKEAGLKTHVIVAIGSCLIMIISKYGFMDLIVMGIKQDPSRIAAQIVSGVGFLGAGMILIRKNMVSGLTTAAGIWATSGIGMAIGAGMYLIGILSTVMLIVLMYILNYIEEKYSNTKVVYIEFTLTSRSYLEEFNQFLEKYIVQVVDFHFEQKDTSLTLSYGLVLQKNYRLKDIVEGLSKLDYVSGINF